MGILIIEHPLKYWEVEVMEEKKENGLSNTGNFIKDSHGNEINPIGYQNVLYFTIVLYIIAFLISLFMVKPYKEEK